MKRPIMFQMTFNEFNDKIPIHRNIKMQRNLIFSLRTWSELNGLLVVSVSSVSTPLLVWNE